MRARRLIAAMAPVTTLAGGTLSLGAVLPGTALTAAPAAASGSDEANLVALTNQARASDGDPALSMASSLSSVARSWAQTMAAQGGISHNPDLASQVDGWSRLGENVGVGVGASIDEVHQALLASPHHYENITGDFSLVGIGVASGGADLRGGGLRAAEWRWAIRRRGRSGASAHGGPAGHDHRRTGAAATPDASARRRPHATASAGAVGVDAAFRPRRPAGPRFPEQPHLRSRPASPAPRR